MPDRVCLFTDLKPTITKGESDIIANRLILKLASMVYRPSRSEKDTWERGGSSDEMEKELEAILRNDKN